MSVENLYEYLQGESQSITRWAQVAASGSDPVFIRDPNQVKMLCASIELWDAESGGTQLTLDTDYTLQYFDSQISGAEGVECYAGYAIINPVYQGIALYVTATCYGGYTSRPYRPTFSETDANITVVPTSDDDSIIADSSGGDITVTLPDGERKNQRFSILCTGGGVVTIAGTGVTDAEFTDLGITYVWDGAKWIQSGGAGSGGAIGLQVPQPKTWVEKWNDGGAGNITSKVNEWGTGIYLIEFTLTATGAGSYTAVFEISDTAVTSRYRAYPEVGSSTSAGDFIFDGADQTFKYSLAGSVAAGGIISISRWEDDPDNLPLLEIPADPGIIKDWVEKFGPNQSPASTPAQSVTNAWGTGKYMIDIRVTANDLKATTTIDLYELTLGNTIQAGAPGVSDYGVYYDIATGKFDTGTSANLIEAIYRWEDVAATDAQLNPPVDGWETVYEDWTNTSPVTNNWGDGTYEITCYEFVGNATAVFYLTIDSTKPTNSETYSAQFESGSGQISAFYDHVANQFKTLVATYTGKIGKIRKFNSLVNVYHSYHPDPRQVAQKDWVEIWNDGGAGSVTSITNVWGVGRYRWRLENFVGSDNLSGIIDITEDDLAATANYTYGTVFAPASSYAGVRYDRSTQSFTRYNATYGGEIVKLERWEDSIASDSPRTVLDDGFETVYENEANTTNVTLAVENGTYEVVLGQSGSVKYTATIAIDNGVGTCQTAWLDTNSLVYTVSTGVWSTGSAPNAIKRIRKVTGKTVIDAQYNVTSLSDGPNQVQAINTDAGDVAVTLPSAPSLGDLFEVWNTGTNGNHVTGLPDSIALGDGKGIRLRYVDGWKYEDVIIDEYSTTSGITGGSGGKMFVTKWARGRMKIRMYGAADTNVNTFVYPETFIGDVPRPTTGADNSLCFFGAETLTGCTLTVITAAGGATNKDKAGDSEGRWK